MKLIMLIFWELNDDRNLSWIQVNLGNTVDGNGEWYGASKLLAVVMKFFFSGILSGSDPSFFRPLTTTSKILKVLALFRIFSSCGMGTSLGYFGCFHCSFAAFVIWYWNVRLLLLFVPPSLPQIKSFRSKKSNGILLRTSLLSLKKGEASENGVASMDSFQPLLDEEMRKKNKNNSHSLSIFSNTLTVRALPFCVFYQLNNATLRIKLSSTIIERQAFAGHNFYFSLFRNTFISSMKVLAVLADKELCEEWIS